MKMKPSEFFDKIEKGVVELGEMNGDDPETVQKFLRSFFFVKELAQSYHWERTIDDDDIAGFVEEMYANHETEV